MNPIVFCALDTADRDAACALAARVGPVTSGIKIGLEFFNAHGPQGVRTVLSSVPGVRLFLDLKFHDIPHTVAGAVRAAVGLSPLYLNIHAAGGAEMMRAASQASREESARLGLPAVRLLAVTVLTSLDDANLASVGQYTPASDQVVRLAHLAQSCGLDGVVCSAHEIVRLRAELGPDFVLMVPGIRPAGTAHGDQKRVLSPAQALAAGATHLVIGRPITEAPDPVAAARAILSDLGAAAA